MQNGANPYYANSAKRFLLTTFGKDRVIGRSNKIGWPPYSVDLTSIEFWLWGYLKSIVYHSLSSTLAELKDSSYREVSANHCDMLHSAVTGVVSSLSCVEQCSGTHVEQLFL
ncbi:uncharacterized protein TNCV_3302261 [Trichonephila clavipes]|nr:uncharacterized protein TNCV_3302261 [Trichonephila clavipes]